jgi:hypothetical protein
VQFKPPPPPSFSLAVHRHCRLIQPLPNPQSSLIRRDDDVIWQQF